MPTGAAPGGVAWADLAAKVQSDLSKIAIKINIKQTTQATLLDSYRAQKGQLVMILWGPDFGPNGALAYTEAEARATGLAVAPGHLLMRRLFGQFC